MGCDIHLFAEKKVKPFLSFFNKVKWISIDKWSKNEDYPDYSSRELTVEREDSIYTGGRNYNLFCALAGVRSGSFIGAPPILSKPKGLPNNCCDEVKIEAASWGSDGHSHSWATLKMLLEFDWSKYGETCQNFIDEVFPKLSKHCKNPEDVRIVFWFDN